MEARVTVGTILSRTFGLLGLAPLPALAAFAVITSLWAAADLSGDATGGIGLLALLAGLAAPYMLTSDLLRRLGIEPENRRGRIWSYIGAGFVTGLGICLGLVLLIVPGLYLLARWSIVTPLIVGEGLAMNDAMRESGRRTDGMIVPIAIACLVLALPPLALLAFTLADSGVEAVSLPGILLADVVTGLSAVAGTYCCVAIYDLTRSGNY
jgi:hypothetical protein